MKCLSLSISFSFIFLFFSSLAYAGWQVAKPRSVIPSEPFFQAGMEQDQTFLPSYGNDSLNPKFAHMGQSATQYAISVSGSLKQNIERIMHRYHWKVIWKAPYDYNFDGRVTGASLPDVIKKLLQPFPLQAQLYLSNHIMTVTPRKT